jgi:hypothetical protein
VAALIDDLIAVQPRDLTRGARACRANLSA